MLAMAGCPRPRSRCGVVAAKQMHQVRGFQSRGSISQPLLVDQQRKRDPGFLAEKPRVLAVPQSHGSQPGSRFLECLLVLAQLRDVFTAENSAVVPQKNEHRWTAHPQRPENHFPSIAIRKSDLRQLSAKRLFHEVSILRTASLPVNPSDRHLFLNAFGTSAKVFIVNDIRYFSHLLAYFDLDCLAKSSHSLITSAQLQPALLPATTFQTA